MLELLQILGVALNQSVLSDGDAERIGEIARFLFRDGWSPAMKAIHRLAGNSGGINARIEMLRHRFNELHSLMLLYADHCKVMFGKRVDNILDIDVRFSDLADLVIRWKTPELFAPFYQETTLEWPMPFEAVTCDNGIEIIPVTNFKGLLDEGCDGFDAEGINGLSHRGSLYGLPAAAGICSIVSLRVQDGIKPKRLATAILLHSDTENGVRIFFESVMGFGGNQPSEDVMVALKWFNSTLKAGDIKFSKGHIEYYERGSNADQFIQSLWKTEAPLYRRYWGKAHMRSLVPSLWRSLIGY